MGSVLVSVNGVRTEGLSFANVVQLLNTRERPMVLEYVDSWDTIFHQHHMETQVLDLRARARRDVFSFLPSFDADSLLLLSLVSLVLVSLWWWWWWGR